LATLQKIPGHPLQVLQILAGNDPNTDSSVRQAASVLFKNFVKKNWNVDAETEDLIPISQEERNLIKSNLVQLMSTAPPLIQSQCSEAISLIADVDFPAKWTNLLPDLIAKFNTNDINVLNGSLSTANSILKRFRYVERSDALYEDILYTLKLLQEPLLALFQHVGVVVEALANSDDRAQRDLYLVSLRTMCRIFYSLNYQDLPEYFEDHITEWMTEFAKYLRYPKSQTSDDDDDEKPSSIDRLQAAIVENLTLYADKDEEPFLPHLPNFTAMVWHLLLGLSSQPKHDNLATTSIKFLSLLVSKPLHRAIFQEESTLQEIISKIVVPNLMIRSKDEECFEDDPQEFILGDIEGSDTESRRKCSQELLRSMCRQFEAETTKICLEHITSMLQKFASSPQQNWTCKDVAIHLMLAISIRTESRMGGVSETNENVNILDFFAFQILPELQDLSPSVRPMVKATSIKFVTTFRNQFDREHLPGLIPLLIHHLASPSVVVHTYSAIAVEKIASARVKGPECKLTVKFQRADLAPFFEALFTGLFSIVDNPTLADNEYVMKSIMRLLSFAGEDIIPVTPIVLQKLTTALERASKNPCNPHFNHCLFESIAILIRSVCSKDPSHVTAFEGFLFPPFQAILQLDISEFTPYVFQLLAQLLEFRSKGLGQAYESLLPPLLTPVLWERKGNIPALVRLLQAYLEKGSGDSVLQAQLLPILGIFQKLLASRASEANAFDLLATIIERVPKEKLQPRMRDVMQLILMRLQHGKTLKFVRLATHFFALFICLYGAQEYLDQLNVLQPGLGLMILVQVWIPHLITETPIGRLETKIMVLGLSKLLCDVPNLLSNADGQKIWGDLLSSILRVIASPNAQLGTTDLTDDFEVEITYDAAYSRLQYASRPLHDPFPDINDASALFLQQLYSLCNSQPEKISSIIQTSLQSEPKLLSGLELMFQKSGMQLTQTKK
jgi:exportin-2 (importin alpha re-exporter)